MSSNKIAVLAWGSLINEPGVLSTLIDSQWQSDGPKLPIEFARKSNDGRLTLVIFGNYMAITERWIKTHWCYIHTSIDHSISFLAKREKCPLSRIGIFYPSNGFILEDKILRSINVWALKKEIDAVIWTNLPATFNSENEILKYSSCLKGDVHKEASKYIISTPIQTKTYLRKKIEKILLGNIDKKT